MEERGLAPIISTLLLIVVFALAATAVGTVISGFFPTETGPLVVFGDFRAESSGSVTTISFSHLEGEEINPAEIRVVVSGQTTEGVTLSTTLQVSSSTPIKFNDNVEVTTLSSAPYYEDEVTVSVIYTPSGKELARERIVVE